MRFGLAPARARSRNRRRFGFAAFEPEYRLEPKFMAAAFVTYLPGSTNSAFAMNNQPIYSRTSPGDSGTVTYDNGNPGGGTVTSSATAGATIGVASGPQGGAGITIGAVLNGQINGSSTANLLGGCPAFATVRSDDGAGNPAALAFNYTETTPTPGPPVTQRNLNITFTISGSDGVNSPTSCAVIGAFSLTIVVGTATGETFQVHMNDDNNAGLQIQRTPDINDPDPTPTTLYSDAALNGGQSGVINYIPNVGSAPGSASFSGAAFASLVVPANTDFFVQYTTNYTEGAAPGVWPGNQIHTIPGMQWSLNMNVS